MRLQRTLYVSENRIRALGLSTARELTEIAETGNRFNTASGLSGVLLVAEDRFLGLLEGPNYDVETAVLRIARDRRNANLFVLSADAVTTRLFSDWTVADRTRLRLCDHPIAADILKAGKPASPAAAGKMLGVMLDLLEQKKPNVITKSPPTGDDPNGVAERPPGAAAPAPHHHASDSPHAPRPDSHRYGEVVREARSPRGIRKPGSLN